MVEVDPGVVVKLVVFSIALVLLPVGVLQASLHGFFDGKVSLHSVASDQKHVLLLSFFSALMLGHLNA